MSCAQNLSGKVYKTYWTNRTMSRPKTLQHMLFCPSSLNIPQMWNYQISARMGNLKISTHELQRPDWFTRWDMVKSSEIYACVSPNLMTWHFEPPKPYRKGHRSLKGNNKDIRGKEQQRNWTWQEHAGKAKGAWKKWKEMKGKDWGTWQERVLD